MVKEVESQTSFAIAISALEYRLYGCPSCGFRSSHRRISMSGTEIRQCAECRSEFAVLSNGAVRSSISICGEYSRLADHPLRGIPCHGREDIQPEGGGEFFISRGIGFDVTPGCFVCGVELSIYNNISGFVRTKKAGKRLVSMFEHGARLDYRDFEPDRIQVKIGACDNHKQNLQWLDELINEAGGVITLKMILESLYFK